MEQNGDVTLTGSDALMVEMYRAYDKGISPNEFRKIKMNDLSFIMDMKKAIGMLADKRSKKVERDVAIQQALQKLKMGARRW